MELLITELSKDKFEITVKADQLTKHIVSVTDQMLLNLTNNKTSKEELLNFSFSFLRLGGTTWLCTCPTTLQCCFYAIKWLAARHGMGDRI